MIIFSFAFAHNNNVFREKTKRYIEEVIKVCKAYKENIIMIQLCNEIPGLNIDNHGDNVHQEVLIDFIKEHFTLIEFNTIFETKYERLEQVQIKDICGHKSYKNLHLNVYYSKYFLEYFKFLKSIYEENALTSNFVHNVYNPRAISLFPAIKKNMPELIIGVDNYFSLNGNLNDKTLAYYCEFGSSYIKNVLKNIPYVLEHESGFWFDEPKIFGQELYLFTIWSFINGYKGINMYLFHEGINKKGMGFNSIDHNWQALVNLQGDKTDKFEAVKKANITASLDTDIFDTEVLYDCALSFEHYPGLIWDSISKKTEEFYFYLFKANNSPEIIDIMDMEIADLKKYPVIYFLVDEKLSNQLQYRIIEIIENGINLVLVGNLPTNDWFKKDTTLIDYLKIEIEKQVKDSFSQKIILGENEIFYNHDNIDKLTTQLQTIAVTNYGDKSILAKDNLLILNGFVTFKMKDQLKIVKMIYNYFNVQNKNCGTDLRILAKKNGTIFILNPYPFAITENLYIGKQLREVNLNGYEYTKINGVI